MRLARVSDVAISPDGKRLIYTERSTDMEADKGRTGLFMLDVSKGSGIPAAERLTDGEVNANSAEWSKDGRFVYFLSNRGGSNQIWRAVPGAEPTQVTHLPLDVGSFRISPRGDRIVVSLDVFIDCAELDCTVQRLAATAKSKATGVMHDSLFVRHWDRWSDGRRSQLYVMTLDGRRGRTRRACKCERRHRRRTRQALWRPRGLRHQSRRLAARLRLACDGR